MKKTLAIALTTATLALGMPAAHADESPMIKALTTTEEKPDVRTKITGIMDKIRLVTPKAVAPTTGTLTSGYAPRWGTFHDGLDIANDIGTPIYAAKAGVVIDAGPTQGYGNWVKVAHDDGTYTLYGHMIAYHVEKGAEVEAGEYIADMGNEGFSTGPHLHFGVYKLDTDESIDPMEWLTENKINDWE